MANRTRSDVTPHKLTRIREELRAVEEYVSGDLSQRRDRAMQLLILCKLEEIAGWIRTR